MVFPFLGLAIGAMAAGGVASAIGASQQARETNRGIDKANSIPLEVEESTSSAVDMTRLVSDAQAAGFNPLTIVRSGGLAAYMSTEFQSKTTGHNAHLYANRQSPGGAALGAIGNTLGNIGGAVLNYGQHAASLASAERIAGMSALPGLGGGGIGAGMSPAYGGYRQSSAPLGSQSHDRWEEELPTVTNPYSIPWIETNPYMPDAGTGWEERYGEMAGTVGGIANFVGDVVWNLDRGIRAGVQALQSVNWSDLWGGQQSARPLITVRYSDPVQ